MGLFNRKKIIQLPKVVADKIAAGEVVDRPVSIVKELVENSIDAGASSLTVEIKNGGKSYIRVTDNGTGISDQEVEIAFLRHATSKITTDADLDEIQTLGFRGEALASIAAVTRTELITKTAEDRAGTKIRVEGGEVVEKTQVGAPEGTTIIVSDLFYNTPARLKFLKQDSTESAQIIDFVSKLALAYPEIKIRLINNGKILFSTSGKGDIFENIVVVYGKETGENLIGFTEEIGDRTTITAYVSNPLFNKTSRRSQFYFVNGRYISDKVLEQAVTEGYGDKVMEGRYPVAFLFLKVPPETVDVNIHPNKREIRFHDAKSVKQAVSKAIFSNLDRKQAIPESKVDSVFKKVTESQDESLGRTAQIELEPSFHSPKMPMTPKTGDTLIVLKDDYDGPDIPDRFVDEVSGRGRTAYSGSNVHGAAEIAESLDTPYTNSINIKDKKEYEKTKCDAVHSIGNTEIENEVTEQAAAKAVSRKHDFRFEDLTITGTVFNTYITASDSQYFYLIDQHAAHERVFYEEFLNKFYSMSNFPQMILEPIIVNVTFAEKAESPGWMEFLIQSGFLIEEFGAKAYIVKAIPSFMTYDEAKGFLNDFVDSVSDTPDYKDRKTVDKIIMRSCKSAVKANDVLHEDEIQRLILDLSKTNNPYSCPHGRPVIVKLGKYELEKMFKRRV